MVPPSRRFIAAGSGKNQADLPPAASARRVFYVFDVVNLADFVKLIL